MTGRVVVAALFLFVSITAGAQTYLIAIVGKDANSPDELAFVALNDIPNGQPLYFTNERWDNSVGDFGSTGEGTIRFTPSALIARGTVVHIAEHDMNANTYVLVGATGAVEHVSGTWSPTAADPFYAFTASDSMNPLTSVETIYALVATQLNGMTATMDPTTTSGMNTTVFPNAVVMNYNSSMVQPVGVEYMADRSLASPATFADSANYSVTTGAGNTVFDLTAYTSAALPVELSRFSVD